MRIEPGPVAAQIVAAFSRLSIALTAALLLAGPSALPAQFVVRSWLDWRTIETAHFALHYPRELEQWTRDVASHIEAIDSAVTGEVGYTPTRKTDIVVDDPYQTPNGSAWPFLDRPAINLWASPPTPRDDIGEFRNWGSMLVSHEFAHIAHLTRPSRNPFMRRLWQALPVDVGPIALRAPRWAIEGYATYIEGRVTGSGRPHGSWRAAFLRQWAIEGQLPRYEQLDAWGAYSGGEFAYLAGSAFLEWLARRQGDSSLVDVWRRLSARQNRGFDDAFTGVFGESPRTLYGRFAAEVTASALDAQRRMTASGDTGSIVQRLAWSTGDPAIATDGRRVALVVRSAKLPSRVTVWNTAPEPDTGKARRDSILLARDPQDVPARAIYPSPKKVVASLVSRGGAPYESPRFFRDGRVLLWRYVPRGDGSLTSDLYIWNIDHHSVRRVTRNASARDGDPSPDGRFALATTCTRGWCDLVRVDLESGAVATIDSGSPRRSFDRPRISPDGTKALVGVHDNDSWNVRVIDLERGTFTTVRGAHGANLYDASWATPTSLALVSEESGIANIAHFDLESAQLRPMTSVSGAAVAPETNPADGSVWFLSLHSRGYDLRRVVGAAPSVSHATMTLDSTLAPVVALPPVAVAAFHENPVSAPRSFDLRARLFRWIPEPNADADGASGALGLVSTDIVGRSELLATAAFGDAAAWRGAALGFTWRGVRPTLSARIFGAAQRLGESRSPIASSDRLNAQLIGALADADRSWQFDSWSARYRAGASVSRLRADSSGAAASASGTRTLLFGNGALSWTQRRGASSISESLGGDVTLGRSFDASFQRTVTTAGFSTTGFTLLPVTASALYGRMSANAPGFEQFTLGGGSTPLLDRSLISQRIMMPALPAGIGTGTSVFAYRAAATTAPVSWYFWAGSTAVGAERFAKWQRVVGLDWSQSIAQIPMAGTPSARALIGVGESLDAPFRRKVRAYISLILNP